MGLDRLDMGVGEEASKVIPRFLAWTTRWRSSIFGRKIVSLGLDVKI